MIVQKPNGFAAPYRSKTFRDIADATTKRNGLMSMDGAVYEDSGNAIVPPFTASQNGLLYSTDSNKTVAIPSGLTAPYFLIVSAVSSVNVDDLQFQFVRSPQDMSDNEVVLAEYDGVEWKRPDLISIDGLIDSREQALVDFDKTGAVSGLLTTAVGPNYVNSAGVIVDKQGLKSHLDQSFTTAKISADPDWRRVDRMLYRRPEDYANRIGKRTLAIGGTFVDSGSQKLYDTQLAASTSVHSNTLCLIAPDNSAHFLYTEGYGASFTIKYQKYNSARTSQLVSATTIVSASSDAFSASIDAAGNIHLAYITGGLIKWVKLNSVGSAIAGPVTVDNRATPSNFPQVSVDPLNIKVMFVYQNELNASNNQIFFASLSLTGAVITAPVQLTSNANNLIHPSLCVTDDLRAYIAYEDLTTGKIYYMVTDDIGAIEVPATYISGNTASTSYGTLVDQASYPTVIVSDNKKLFIAFLQKKTISLSGITVFSNGQAYLQDLTGMSENILDYDMSVDSTNNDINLSVSQSTRYDFIKLSGTSVVMSVSLSGSGTGAVSVKKDQFGSLLHSYTTASPGTYTNVGSPETISSIGPAAIAGFLNTLVLSSNQFAMLVASAPYAPVVGDRAVITGSSFGNNGTYYVTAISTQSINAANDTYVVSVSTNFPATETPAVGVTAQFANPNGNAVRFVKSVADANLARAMTTDELSTDVLLARCVFPGPVILNYVGSSGYGVNSDIFGMFGAINVDWSLTTVNALTMTSGLEIIDLVNNILYTVAGGTYPMSAGDAMYVVLDGVNTSITPQIAQIGMLPWSQPIQVLGFVKGGEFNPHLFSVAGMGELEVGESIILGEEISNNIKVRLGVINDTTYQAYTSLNYIASPDSYPAAISKLDAQVAAIATDTASEESFIVGVGGQTVFNLASIVFDASHAIPDIQVYVNGQKVMQSPDGTLANGDYRKVGTAQIEFDYTVPENATVIVRDERTGGGPAPSVDFTNIGDDIQPTANGAKSVGTVSKAWSGLFLKDTASSQVYRVDITNGVMTLTAVP